jgi:hypothetical protein
MTQAMTNDDFDLAKFIKLMKMTTASVDGEALNAIRMANAMLKRNNHDWEVLLKGKITIVNDPFNSIPTPPAAKAAPPPPPPRPTPPPPPPPQRRPRDVMEVDKYISTIQAEIAVLTTAQAHNFASIRNEWHQHQALFDNSYQWLRSFFHQLDPKPRVRDEVQRFFDTCDFAPLTPEETARFNRIRLEWYRRSNFKMHDTDYGWLEAIHRRHGPRTTAKGKAKRLF